MPISTSAMRRPYHFPPNDRDRPLTIMPGSPFQIEAIDTKGIDGSATRPDIQAILDDPRCVPVLCTTLGDAPGPHYDTLFTQLLTRARFDNSKNGRCC